MGNESCTEIVNHEGGEGDTKLGSEIERSLEIDTLGNNSSGSNIRKKEPTSVTHQDKVTINSLQSTSTLQTHSSTEGVFIAADTNASSDLSDFSEQ